MANRILVVEDSEVQRLAMKIMLRNRGFDVKVATNGSEGWELFQRVTFNAVVTDYQMPVMNGLQLIEEIRQVNDTFRRGQ